MAHSDADPLLQELVEGLDRVLFELARIDDALVHADRTEDMGMIREARRRTMLLDAAAEKFLRWVTDTRLGPPPN